MADQDRTTDRVRRETGDSEIIEDRLLDTGGRRPDEIEAAAEEAFVEEQRHDPDHPSRRQREADREHGSENPSHSRGI